MDKPDKIYVDITETANNEPSWIDRLTVSHPDSLDDDSCHGNPYLLATSERELSSELVEAIAAFTVFFDKAMEGFSPGWAERNKEETALGWNDADLKVSDFLKARAVLAKLEGKG